MPYIYRYIDLEKQETIYVGKVTGFKDMWNDPLTRRHRQHERDEWYKANPDNIIMQFIEINSNTDADILETWLINFYDSEQLYNKSKTKMGKSALNLYESIFGRWQTYGLDSEKTVEELRYALSRMIERTDGLQYDVDISLKLFCDTVKEIKLDQDKANRLKLCGSQSEYLRITNKDCK